MDKPSWINQVKEVDVEEAKVLLAIGIEVWWDYCTVAAAWDDGPFETGQLFSPASLTLADSFGNADEGWCHKVIYVALGSED